MTTLRTRYCAATPFGQFLSGAQANAPLWNALAQRARVSDSDVERMRAAGGRWHLLVLAEDWCGDAVNILPPLAALAERAKNVDLRVVSRDANPDLMDAHLTDGARSIPIVIVLDREFVERGAWGPRPAALQQWFREAGLSLAKEERYREMRGWYARDRGVSAVNEVIAIVEAAGRVARAA